MLDGPGLDFPRSKRMRQLRHLTRTSLQIQLRAVHKKHHCCNANPRAASSVAVITMGHVKGVKKELEFVAVDVSY